MLSLSLDLKSLGSTTGAFERKPVAQAAHWLAENSGSNDIVMAAYRSSSFLGAYISGRVVFGNYMATLEPEEKRDLVETFYQASTQDGWRMDLLSGYGVTYVVHGPYERQLGDFRPEEAPYLELAYRIEDVSLYRVNYERFGGNQVVTR